MNRRGILLSLAVACALVSAPRWLALSGAAFFGLLFAMSFVCYVLRERRWRRQTETLVPSVPDPPDCDVLAEVAPGFTMRCSQVQGHDGDHEGYGVTWPR